MRRYQLAGWLTSKLNGGRRRKTVLKAKRGHRCFFPCRRVKAYPRECHWLLILRVALESAAEIQG